MDYNRASIAQTGEAQERRLALARAPACRSQDIPTDSILTVGIAAGFAITRKRAREQRLTGGHTMKNDGRKVKASRPKAKKAGLTDLTPTKAESAKGGAANLNRRDPYKDFKFRG